MVIQQTQSPIPSLSSPLSTQNIECTNLFVGSCSDSWDWLYLHLCVIFSVLSSLCTFNLSRPSGDHTNWDKLSGHVKTFVRSRYILIGTKGCILTSNEKSFYWIYLWCPKVNSSHPSVAKPSDIWDILHRRPFVNLEGSNSYKNL